MNARSAAPVLIEYLRLAPADRNVAGSALAWFQEEPLGALAELLDVLAAADLLRPSPGVDDLRGEQRLAHAGLDVELYAHDTPGMTIRRRIKRIGGSLGLLLPRDIAEAMAVKEGSEVRLTLVGRQVVVEPADDTLDDTAFRRALAAVLRRHRRTFDLLAAYDRGDWSPPGR
jgi:antitoxin component of MazEF toxin-antitoxin module